MGLAGRAVTAVIIITITISSGSNSSISVIINVIPIVIGNSSG
jgi:hypothetical protein